MSVIRIRSEEDLYNRFDPAQTCLSSDAYNYLKSLYREMSGEERKTDILQIECPEPIDIEKAENAIHFSIGRDIAEYDRQLKINKIKMIRLYVIGVALILVGFALMSQAPDCHTLLYPVMGFSCPCFCPYERRERYRNGVTINKGIR